MITYRQYLADPDAVLKQIRRDARRERAKVVHDLIMAPLKRMCEPFHAQPMRPTVGVER